MEVFFDLVAVVGVAQLAHVLREATSMLDIGIVVALFYAIWSVWLSVTLYVDVAKRASKIRSILTVMFLLGVMAAAIPSISHGDSRTTIFIVAFVVARIVAGRTWDEAGKVLLEWPAAQAAAGCVPWIISIWVDAPWMYALWGLGILIDIVGSVIQAAQGDRLIEKYLSRHDKVVEHTEAQAAKRAERVETRLGQAKDITEADKDRYRERWNDPRKNRMQPKPELAKLDNDHVTERLGLFFVIILGEAVAQMVSGVAAQPTWGRTILIDAVCGFGMLVGIWWITLVRTEDGRPLFSPERLSAQLVVPAHFVMLLALTAIAAGLGGVPGPSGEPLSDSSRWMLCIGVAVFAAEASVLMSFGRAGRGGWKRAALGLPISVLPPLLVAALNTTISATGSILILTLVVCWLLVAVMRPGRPERPSGPVRPAGPERPASKRQRRRS